MGIRSAIRELFRPAQPERPAAPRRRMFQGALGGRLNADWVAANTSIDSEIWGSLRQLRARTRQLVRDSDYAKSALRAIALNTVGNGIPFQAQVKRQRGNKLDTTVNDQIEALWSKWTRASYCHTAGKLCFSDIERIAIRSVAQDGEVFIRMVKQPFDGSPVPLALEVLEADWIDDRMSGRSGENGNEIRMGVEVDRWQRPVAYWFLPQHPGDYLVANAEQARMGKPFRVPANEVIHLFQAERPGQTRGYPMFASCLKNLHQLEGFQEAEVVRARASSSLMGFITSPEGELLGDDVEAGERVQDWSPGRWHYLAPGEAVSVPDLGSPDMQFEAFLRAMLRSVAAGTGVSFESISKDFTQTNYSSSRLSLLEERDHWRMLQRWMIESFHQRVFEQWLEMAVLSGALNLPLYETDPDRYRNVRWMPRGWSWVDPQKEITALREAEMAGYITKTQIIAENGGDIEELLNQRRQELDTISELQLSFDTDQPKTTDAPAAAPSEPSPSDNTPPLP